MAEKYSYGSELANSYNSLAVLYSDTLRYQESEAMYKSAIAIRERLVKANPLAYEPALAVSYNNLAILYRDTHRFAESEEMANAAAAIRERLGIE